MLKYKFDFDTSTCKREGLIEFKTYSYYSIVFKILKFPAIFFHRLFADILNDASILIEMLAPLLKTYFTILACLSSISKVQNIICQ